MEIAFRKKQILIIAISIIFAIVHYCIYRFIYFNLVNISEINQSIPFGVFSSIYLFIHALIPPIFCIMSFYFLRKHNFTNSFIPSIVFMGTYLVFYILMEGIFFTSNDSRLYVYSVIALLIAISVIWALCFALSRLYFLKIDFKDYSNKKPILYVLEGIITIISISGCYLLFLSPLLSNYLFVLQYSFIVDEYIFFYFSIFIFVPAIIVYFFRKQKYSSIVVYSLSFVAYIVTSILYDYFSRPNIFVISYKDIITWIMIALFLAASVIFIQKNDHSIEKQSL